MIDHIPMPDHPVRQRMWYQLFDRLWRPATGWAVFGGTVYAAGLGHAIGKPMEEGYLFVWLTFSGAVLGLKSWEKLKQVA